MPWAYHGRYVYPPTPWFTVPRRTRTVPAYVSHPPSTPAPSSALDSADTGRSGRRSSVSPTRDAFRNPPPFCTIPRPSSTTHTHTRVNTNVLDLLAQQLRRRRRLRNPVHPYRMPSCPRPKDVVDLLPRGGRLERSCRRVRARDFVACVEQRRAVRKSRGWYERAAWEAMNGAKRTQRRPARASSSGTCPQLCQG